MKFQIGQRVRKIKGEYRYSGVVVSAFRKLDGVSDRYVVENADGMLFIFNDRQLDGEPLAPPPRDRYDNASPDDLEKDRRAFLQNNPLPVKAPTDIDHERTQAILREIMGGES